MTIFRPCIDLHEGKVKQIVGGTLQDLDEPDAANPPAGPRINFDSDKGAAWYARKYREDGLVGGHVIQLGPGNESAAKAALAEYPGGLQIGGGITITNAADWLDAGASHVIVTSWLFDETAQFQQGRLEQLAAEIGRDRIVIDLSCKRTTHGWTVAMNRWQTLTDVPVEHATFDNLAEFCDEFLIHAADVEGLCQGIDMDLVRLMGAWGKRPMTYAGGVATMDDVDALARQSGHNVDVTVGSSLDLFGGNGVRYDELVAWSRRRP